MFRAARMLTVIAFVALIAGPVAAADEVGVVTRVQNTAEVLSTGQNRALHAGDTVFADDVLSTGPESRLEVTFADGTSLTLGENAVIAIDEFVYDPDAEDGSAVWDVISGAFLIATGEIAKTSPENVSVLTPYAHIGIRGTQFWGGLIDDGFGVLALEGSVAVTTSGGTVVLSAVGEGTMIKAPGAAPTDPIIWGDEKKARAFETVTFGR